MKSPKRHLGFIRIEKIYFSQNGYFATSSVINLYNILQKKTNSFGLLAPVLQEKGPGNQPSDSAGSRSESVRPHAQYFSIQESDRLYQLPNMSGYLRFYLNGFFLFIQLIRMRKNYKTVICRAPEHGNLLLFPLLSLLRFNVYIWIVHDRQEVLIQEQRRRKKEFSFYFGKVFNILTGAVENYFTRKWPVICNGQQLYQKMLSLNRNSEAILKIVSSTFSEELIPNISINRQIDTKIIKLLYVGRISPEKGISDLLHALNDLKQSSNIRYELLLVGPAAHGEKERLEKTVKNYELDNVVFIGPVGFGEDLFEYYRQADIFVLPSFVEGTPRVLIEAMAFGLPIVATNVGGVPDVISEGKNGLLVDPGNPESLSGAIQRLVNNNDLYQEISRRNSEQAKELTVEKMVDQMLAFVWSHRGV